MLLLARRLPIRGRLNKGGTLDADGVALTAIQGLYEIMQDKDCEIEELKAKAASVEQLDAKVAALEALVNKLAAQSGGGR